MTLEICSRSRCWWVNGAERREEREQTRDARLRAVCAPASCTSILSAVACARRWAAASAPQRRGADDRCTVVTVCCVRFDVRYGPRCVAMGASGIPARPKVCASGRPLPRRYARPYFRHLQELAQPGNLNHLAGRAARRTCPAPCRCFASCSASSSRPSRRPSRRPGSSRAARSRAPPPPRPSPSRRRPLR